MVFTRYISRTLERHKLNMMELTKGIIKTPSKDLLYGVEGVGKTSLAATYPNAIFIDTEGSTTKLDVTRVYVKNYDQFKEAMKFVISEAGNEFDTVVFDTTDWLENIVIQQILKEDKTTTITDRKVYAYGAGEKRIEEFFRKQIILTFEAIMATGKNVVLVAHGHIKAVDCPLVGRYDRYTLKMGKSSAAVLMEWVNNTFFLNYKTYLERSYGIEKDKAKGGSQVYIHTQRTPQYDAKRRDKLPDEIEFKEGVNPYPDIIGINRDKK